MTYLTGLQTGNTWASGASNMWKPIGDNQRSAWIGYDFTSTGATNVQSIRLKQFPNQYCVATPALQYSDDKVTWQTKFRLQCASECPNNATGTEPQMGWVLSPGKGTVAPPAPPGNDIGGIVDWFSFRPVDSSSSGAAAVH
jgi:hypothetical protein